MDLEREPESNLLGDRAKLSEPFGRPCVVMGRCGAGPMQMMRRPCIGVRTSKRPRHDIADREVQPFARESIKPDPLRNLRPADAGIFLHQFHTGATEQHVLQSRGSRCRGNRIQVLFRRLLFTPAMTAELDPVIPPPYRLPAHLRDRLSLFTIIYMHDDR